MKFDFVRVNAAEDQQMVIFGQVMQGPYDSVKPLVPPEEAKDADQLAFLGNRVQHGEFIARSGATNILHFGGGEKGKRMVVDVSHAVDEFHVREVTTGVHYQGDRLE